MEITYALLLHVDCIDKIFLLLVDFGAFLQNKCAWFCVVALVHGGQFQNLRKLTTFKLGSPTYLM